MFESPSFPLVLGHTWLVKHKPPVNWGSKVKSISQWGLSCYDHCSPTLTHVFRNREQIYFNLDSDDEGVRLLYSPFLQINLIVKSGTLNMIGILWLTIQLIIIVIGERLGQKERVRLDVVPEDF